MERILDKVIIAACCVATLFSISYSTEVLVGMLLAISISALRETYFMPIRVRDGFALAYLLGALVFPGFAVFLPLAAYDCFRMGHWVLRLSWVIPLFAGAGDLPATSLLFSTVFAVVACGLSWRTNRTETERDDNLRLRDGLRELSISLEQKNRGLQEKQDLEVKLATLDERARIAREIHDNVGHLLTRSVLQIEAMQVVHAQEPAVKQDLEQVGATVREAFDTVRDSIHDLHDDSFDLYTQLFATAKACSALDIVLDYQARTIPLPVGYCFLAIVREALANTAKHSDATKMKVSVVEYPAILQLIVHDNGSRDPFAPPTSFDKAPHPAKAAGIDALSGSVRGIGLRTMEERTRSIGGVFRIDYNRGLRIFVSVPHADSFEEPDRAQTTVEERTAAHG